MNTSRRSLLFVVMALSVLLSARQARAQSGIELEGVGAVVQFGQQIAFTATIKSPVPIQSVSISITDQSQGLSRVEPVSVDAGGRTEFRLDTRQAVLPPFTYVRWSYQIALSDGSVVQSEWFSTRYGDDRFEWQSLESGALRVNWYGGDASVGQAALNAAQAGLGSVSRVIAVDLSQPVEIFIYTSSDDLRGTLKPGDDEWVAGHANPALGVVMVVIEPGAQQNIQMEQRIPHELMHVMMYRALGAGYASLPLWLREGTATMAELYPNADYDRVLADAGTGEALIPISSLCASFPANAGRAFLAYAESRSFTGYLLDTYGSSGLMKLAASYAEGVDCERGTELALGVSLSSLEQDWRTSVLGQHAMRPALQNMMPYLVLLCFVLIIPLIGILTTLRKKGNQNGPERYAG